ncbi:MAG: hypothetical protein ACR2P8_06905, partial [Myxococcota bacterium]
GSRGIGREIVRTLAERVAQEALAGRRPDLVISCGEDSETKADAARHCALRDLVGESLGARGALGAALASLSLAAGATPAGEALPAQGGTVLITDFEPGANHVSLTLRAAGEGA